MHEHRRGLVPRVEFGVRSAADETTCEPRCSRATTASLERARYGPAPAMTQRQPVGAERRPRRAAWPSAAASHVEPLVALEAADADDDEVAGGDAVALPHDRAVGRTRERASTSRRSMPFGIGAHLSRRAVAGGAPPSASSATSVAMMQSAARARRRTAHRSGAYPSALQHRLASRAWRRTPRGPADSARAAPARRARAHSRARSRRSRERCRVCPACDERARPAGRRAGRTAGTPCCDRGSSCRAGWRTET